MNLQLTEHPRGQIECLNVGNPSSENITLICHAAATGAPAYTHLATLLAEGGARVIVPNFFGYGKTKLSTIEDKFTLRDNVSLVEFLLQMNPTAQVHLVGHSMGGHGALICGLKCDHYKSISAFAPISNPINCPWGIKAFEGYLGNKEDNIDLWKEYDASCLLENINKDRLINILIDQGTSDEFYVKKQSLAHYQVMERCG